jgi:manganese oxidase
MSTPRSQKQDFWSIFAACTAVAAMFFGIVAVYAAAGGGGGGTQVASAPVAVTLGDLFVEPTAISVPAGGSLTVTNEGQVPHDLAVDGADLATPMLDAGATATLDLADLEPGTYTVYCTVAGHRSAGMEATLTITEGGPATAVAAAGADEHAGHATGKDMDWKEMDRLMTESVAGYPAETEGLGGEVLEPKILSDGTKEFELTAEVVDWEVEPGKVVEAWTYNGVVPAPTIKTEVGDKVRMVVKNDLPMSTDVHWHGIKVPMDQDGVAPITQEFIEPGETYVYEFTTDHPAVAMYHPHHHGYEKIPNGMLGTFLVGQMPVPDGVEVAQEIPMVLNDAGTIGYALNGKSFPATAPIVAKKGEWVMVHYLNEGVMPHPMHLHRFDQLVIAKDGHPLPAPYKADTINVAPGERYTILVKAEEVGTWAWHCHILTHAERADGMFGMVTTMIVE